MVSFREFTFCTWAIIIYAKLWMLDMIDYYFKLFTLCMPTCVFGNPIIKIMQSQQTTSDADSDSEDNLLTECNVYIAQIILIFDASSNKMKTRELHGGQLRPFVDKYGKFYIGEIEKYFNNLNTIYIRYIKDNGSNEKSSKMIIDVKKRYDNYNSKSCRLGVVF